MAPDAAYSPLSYFARMVSDLSLKPPRTEVPAFVTIICRSVRGYQASYKFRPKIGVLNRLDIDTVESNTAGSLIFNTQKVVDFLNLVVLGK